MTAPARVTGGDASERLAVYGTLAPGESNADVLARLGGTWTRGTVRGTRHGDGWHGYPGLVLDDGGDVPVDVLESAGLVDAWDTIDSFEGPGYRRVAVTVTLDDGVAVAAQVYVLAGAPTGG